MAERNEPTLLFKIYTYVSLSGSKAYILGTNTYCTKCDRFLDEPTYTIKDIESGKVHQNVPENLLDFYGE